MQYTSFVSIPRLSCAELAEDAFGCWIAHFGAYSFRANRFFITFLVSVFKMKIPVCLVLVLLLSVVPAYSAITNGRYSAPGYNQHLH